MDIIFNLRGTGCKSKIHILIDGDDGEEIGCCNVGADDSIASSNVKCVINK